MFAKECVTLHLINLPKKVHLRRLTYHFLHVTCLIVALSCYAATAMADTGASVFNFLGLPYSARINAMGGTNISLNCGDLASAMCNPALLSERTDKQLQLNYSFYGANQHFASALYGHNFGRSAIESPGPDKPNYFAVGVHYLNYGKMTYADEYGNLLGTTFNAQDILFDIMYARQLGPMFSIGVSLKPVYSAYEVYSSFALGADVGGYFTLPEKGLEMGLSLQNIGWQLKGFYTNEGGDPNLEMLPINLQLGLSYKLPHAPLRFSFTAHNLQKWNLEYQVANIGQKHGEDPTEYYNNTHAKWYDMMFRHTIWAVDIVPKSGKFWLTLSYNHRRHQELSLKDSGNNVERKSLAGFAAGAGLDIKGIRLGVALSQYTRSNLVYQLSIGLDINQLMK